MDAEIRSPAHPPRPHMTGERFVKVAACVIILVAGLKAAQDLLVPIVLAGFMAMVCMRPINKLRQRGLPAGLAIAVTVLLLIVLLLGVILLVGGSAADFSEAIPSYQERFEQMLHGAIERLESVGVDLDETKASMVFDSKRILKLVSDVVGSLLGALSNFFLILLVMIFILIDAQDFAPKLRMALGSPNADLSRFQAIKESVNTYLAVKTWVSFLTGLTIGIFAALIGLDFPFLWGFVAFVFNFIPNIGSLIAAIPAVLLGLLQGGLDFAVLVAVGYVVSNQVFGNILEPRLLGRKMGLSVLTVFLSLIVWSWIWGPIGMLLSVPLTMVLKIGLESTPDGWPIAVMLGSGPTEEKPAPRTPPES